MKPYIDFNKQLRTHATNDFEKDFFKLMNNAVFTETMENIRKHRNIKVVMNKPVYLGQAILDLSKIVMYEFHYDYMKPKYGENLNLCYMDTDSLIYQIKTEDFYADIADDVPMRFDMSGYNPDCSLPIGLKKKVIGLMKDELRGTIMTEFVALRPMLYSYRKLDGA